MFQAQKTQRFGIQIRFSFLAITCAFLVRFSIPAPVSKSVLWCGSNAILHWKIGWVIPELYRVKVNLAFFSLVTVIKRFINELFHTKPIEYYDGTSFNDGYMCLVADLMMVQCIFLLILVVNPNIGWGDYELKYLKTSRPQDLD